MTKKKQKTGEPDYLNAFLYCLAIAFATITILIYSGLEDTVRIAERKASKTYITDAQARGTITSWSIMMGSMTVVSRECSDDLLMLAKKELEHGHPAKAERLIDEAMEAPCR